MSEEIIGVEKPAGSSRPPWWVFVLAILGVLTLGAVGFDAITKSDSERAAEVVVEFFDAYVQGDGERACPLLTEESQAEEIKLSKLIDQSVSGCPEAVAVDLAQTRALGGSVEGAGELDSSEVEDALEIDGDEATLDAGSDLTTFTLALRKVDGEWLVDLTGIGTAPAPSPSADASDAELIDAGDQICVTALPRSATAIADLSTPPGPATPTASIAPRRRGGSPSSSSPTTWRRWIQAGRASRSQPSSRPCSRRSRRSARSAATRPR